MRKTILFTALIGALTFATIGATSAGATGAASTTAAFSGTISEIVDPAAETGIPRRWMRHVGDPAPEGYGHGYQWGAPSITTPANAGPITFTGTLDVSAAVAGNFGLLGLLDTATLAADERGLNEGSYIYLFQKNAAELVIGLSDGRAAGGEYVQTFHTMTVAGTDGVLDIVFTIDPDADPATCATDAADVSTAEGCMTLQVDNLALLSDSYGSITNDAANGGVEFRDGGTAGWDGLASATADTGFAYDLTITPVTVVAPETKDDCQQGGWMNFGFSNQGLCIKSIVAAD